MSDTGFGCQWSSIVMGFSNWSRPCLKKKVPRKGFQTQLHTCQIFCWKELCSQKKQKFSVSHCKILCFYKRFSGLKVKRLDSGLKGPGLNIPYLRVYCRVVVIISKTLDSHSAFLHMGMNTSVFLTKGNTDQKYPDYRLKTLIQRSNNTSPHLFIQ